MHPHHGEGMGDVRFHYRDPLKPNPSPEASPVQEQVPVEDTGPAGKRPVGRPQWDREG